jgi:deoxyadenosine/deoxycytidine kinase
MSITAQKVIKRLREEHPELLADVKKEEDVVIDLSKVDGNTPPSEIKKLADAIARKRMVAPGLADSELKELMRRINK